MSLDPWSIIRLTRLHGGLVCIETAPMGIKNWGNTLVCEDGFRYTLTKREEDRLMNTEFEWREDGVEIKHIVKEREKC